MKESNEGFLYPDVDTGLCVECGLCRNVCQGNIPRPVVKLGQIYAAWSLDDSIRQTSSSGGIFYSLAKEIILTGGVVFGAVFGDAPGTVAHTWTDNLSGLKPMQGSKYIQSEIGYSYKLVKQFLCNGKTVLFTGTPCQVFGLYSYLGNTSISNLYTMDFVCHGVPSKLAFKSYFGKLVCKYGHIDYCSYRFRNLQQWNYQNSAIINGARFVLQKEDNLYFSMFLSGLLNRESCYHCKFATTSRCSDITVGDFWGIGQERPVCGDTSKGCSLVLPNTNTGSGLLAKVSQSLYLDPRNISEAKTNTQLFMPTVRPNQRDTSYGYLMSHSLSRTYYKYFSTYFKFLRHTVYQRLFSH